MRRLLSACFACVALALAGSVANACSSYGEEEPAISEPSDSGGEPVEGNASPPPDDGGDDDATDPPDGFVSPPCNPNAAFCERFDDGKWRTVWTFHPPSSPIQEDGVNFVSRPFGVRFESLGSGLNAALSYLERPIAMAQAKRYTLSAFLRIENGNGTVDVLSLEGDPGPVLITGTNEEIAFQTPSTTGVGMQNLQRINVPAGTFVHVRLVLDRVAHTATFVGLGDTVMTPLVQDWVPKSVRVGFSYSLDVTSRWKVEVDDVELLIE